MTRPASRAGDTIVCPTCCNAVRGSRCTSRTGRTRKETHDNRMRAERAGDPVRVWLDERMTWRSA